MVFYWTDGFSIILSVRENQFVGDRGQGVTAPSSKYIREILKLLGHPICEFRPRFLVKIFFLEIHAALHSRTASQMI